MERDPYRKKVWGTTLGVNAKLTLLALGEVSEGDEKFRKLTVKSFEKLRWMLGRKLANCVKLIERLVEQRILVLQPNADGYDLEFHPENEIRNNGRPIEDEK